MPTLTLTLDADGTIDAVIDHDAGTGTPFYTHCNDTPDGGSSDYVQNDVSETSGVAWFSLSNVPTDFSSIDTLDCNVDAQAVAFGNDTCTLTARIYDADNDTTNALTNETGTLASDTDSTRVQRTVSFSGLTGTKTQWDAAHIRLTWTYTKSAGPDNANLRLFGIDVDGTYTADTNVVMSADSGSFSWSGVAATFKSAAPVVSGTFSATSTVATLRRADAVVSGAFSMSGVDASFDGSMPVTSGVFVVTGTDATLITGGGSITLTADAGAFVVSGVDASTDRTTLTASGSYATTGTAGTFATVAPVESVAFDFLGITASLLIGSTLTADAGSSTVAGIDASFGSASPALSASFETLGTTAGFSRQAAVDTGAFSISGIASFATATQVDSALFAFAGSSASLQSSVAGDLSYDMAAGIRWTAQADITTI